MSEISYQDNVELGVVGPDSSNCLGASYDRFSIVTGVQTQTYQHCEKVRLAYEELVGDGSNYVPPELIQAFKDMKTLIRKDLGVSTNRNIVETRVDTQDELRSKLGRLSVGGFRTAVYLDVDGLHAVGIKALDAEHFTVKSTWSPFPEDEPVHVSDIFSYLDLAPRQRVRETSGRKTIKSCNIVAIPPETRLGYCIVASPPNKPR